MTLQEASLHCPSRLDALTPKLLMAVAGEPTLYGALAAIAQGFVEIFGALEANVRVLRADGRTLDLVSSYGLASESEPPSIHIHDATPVASAVRRRSIQFVSLSERHGTQASGASAARRETLCSLPLVGDDRVLGAVTGCFTIPLTPGDCEQLSDLGQILGALLELSLLGNSTAFESTRTERESESGFWRQNPRAT